MKELKEAINYFDKLTMFTPRAEKEKKIVINFAKRVVANRVTVEDIEKILSHWDGSIFADKGIKNDIAEAIFNLINSRIYQ